jgi:hypothetical protein
MTRPISDDTFPGAFAIDQHPFIISLPYMQLSFVYIPACVHFVRHISNIIGRI